MNTSDKIERLKAAMAAAKKGTPEYDSLYKSSLASGTQKQQEFSKVLQHLDEYGYNIEPPYFKNMYNDFAVSDIDEQEYIMSKVFDADGIEVKKEGDSYQIKDRQGNILYIENRDGEYDDMRNSSLNESTEVKKIKDLMKRINII